MAKKWKKRLSKAVKTVGRKVARAGISVAPIAGALLLGPAGAAAGTALGAGLSQVHQKGDTRGKRKARLGRAIKIGGSALVVAGGASLLAGGGLTTGIIGNVGTLFKGTGGAAAGTVPGQETVPFDWAGQAGAQPIPTGTGTQAPNTGGFDSFAGGGNWASAITAAGGIATTMLGGTASTPGVPGTNAGGNTTNREEGNNGVGDKAGGGGMAGLFDSPFMLIALAAVVLIGLGILKF